MLSPPSPPSPPTSGPGAPHTQMPCAAAATAGPNWATSLSDGGGMTGPGFLAALCAALGSAHEGLCAASALPLPPAHTRTASTAASKKSSSASRSSPGPSARILSPTAAPVLRDGSATTPPPSGCRGAYDGGRREVGMGTGLDGTRASHTLARRPPSVGVAASVAGPPERGVSIRDADDPRLPLPPGVAASRGAGDARGKGGAVR
jgi:hypothetical protein